MNMNQLTTKEILWLAIKDIENGNAFTIKEDPINGWLKGNNTKLTKVNISDQSAKYTENNKPVSRPTIDAYPEIVEYIEKNKLTGTGYNERICTLEEENKNLKNIIKELNNLVDNLSQENYKLQNTKNIINIHKERT